MFHIFHCSNHVTLRSSDLAICHGLHVHLGYSRRTQLLCQCIIKYERTVLTYRTPQVLYNNCIADMPSYFTEHFKKRLSKLVYKEHDFYKWLNRVFTVVMMIVRSFRVVIPYYFVSYRVWRTLRDSLASSEFSERLFSEHATLFSGVGSDTLTHMLRMPCHYLFSNSFHRDYKTAKYPKPQTRSYDVYAVVL